MREILSPAVLAAILVAFAPAAGAEYEDNPFLPCTVWAEPVYGDAPVLELGPREGEGGVDATCVTCNDHEPECWTKP